MNLEYIDKQIHNCNLCGEMVEKFPNNKTVSQGNNDDIVILGEAPANNGWRKSGVAWYDVNHKLLPSGVVMQKLLDILDIKLEDTYFLETIKRPFRPSVLPFAGYLFAKITTPWKYPFSF